MNDTSPIPDGASQVIRTFVAAGKRGDVEAMKACLTKNTLESGCFRGENPPGVDFVPQEPRREDGRIIVPLKVVPEGSGPDAEALDELPCVVVEEDGAWKFDLAATLDLKMGGMQQAMEQAMAQMGEAMSGAMSGMAEAMQAAFGSGEGDARTSWDDVPDVEADQLAPVPETEVLPTVQAAVSEAMGFPVRVGVDLAGFQRLFAVDEPDTLRTWFDQQLLVNLPEMLASTRNYMPLEARLTAVRLEPADSAQERSLVMDGTELVYRLDPRTQDGFYSDGELHQILLPLLAGAPGHDDPEMSLPGKSFFPPAEAILTFDDYMPVAQRWMKKISSLLGRYIALDVEWGEIASATMSPRTLYTWGLNRVYGGLAAVNAIYSPADYSVRGALDAIHTVHLRAAFSSEDRAAYVHEGVLEIAMAYALNEPGGLYEHQIAAAFKGEPTVPAGDAWGGEVGSDAMAEAASESAVLGSDDLGAMAGEAVDATVDLSDPYAVAAMYMDKLEAEMYGAGMYPPEPAPEPLEIHGAFGQQNMTLEQWLAWVLIPRVREIASSRSGFPRTSSVGAYAVREFDGRDEAAGVIGVLSQFDAYVEGLADAESDPDR